jgi:glycosyltransferase involved in cell wall biosynthesis
MKPRFAAVVPVKDGARYLAELLAAVAREGVDEVLVIDSGSSDDSPRIAREAGARVLEIAPAEFGHGRTRNLGAERTSAEIVAFLTQDATPVEGWREALLEGFAADEHVGAVYGPHLPRADTSPMIARELVEFFSTFAPHGGEPRVFGPGDPAFLSNVNAAYRRECWAELRFDDVPYSEDQAFGRVLAAHPRWRKVYAPRAGVLHAHDYPPAEFMRRYFDEYRGLRETIGHVERFGVRTTVRDVRALVAGDRRWMRERGYSRGRRAHWTARSVVHHTGRKTFSALGSRGTDLPAPVQRALSLEGRADGSADGADQPPAIGAAPVPDLPPVTHQPRREDVHGYAPIARVVREGPAPLLAPVPGMADRERLHIAFVIPEFSIGSGGHNIVFQLVLRLERMGHTCSLWLHDTFGQRAHEGAAVMRRNVVEHFAPIAAPLYKGFDHWYGADVAVATGWQTVFPLLEQTGVRARAYLINDHEPEFYPTSVESVWAAETYRQGLYGVAGSQWLRELYVERYGGSAGTFQYGVDHDVYYPRPIERRRDTVVFYCRTVTQRRAVALGILALAALHERRPDLRIVLFGDRHAVTTPFPYDHIGIASPEQLAWVFSEATVGICLSLTNYSLIPQEMLACGLPCVDLEGASASSVFGVDGPVELVPFDVDALAAAVEGLLDDRARWQRRSDAGVAFVAPHTWDLAATQVEAELRAALRLREAVQMW